MVSLSSQTTNFKFPDKYITFRKRALLDNIALEVRLLQNCEEDASIKRCFLSLPDT